MVTRNREAPQTRPLRLTGWFRAHSCRVMLGPAGCVTVTRECSEVSTHATLVWTCAWVAVRPPTRLVCCRVGDRCRAGSGGGRLRRMHGQWIGRRPLGHYVG